MRRGVMLVMFFAILVLTGCASAPISYHERHYQTLLCDELGGEMEVVLADRTRVDCLTDEYAIEVDFAKKWAESIGQSLYYSEMTGKKAAVALIVGERDKRFLKRLKRVSTKFNIKIYILNKGE